MRPTDEQLMRFADGETTDAEHAAIRAAVEADAALRRKVDALRAQRERLRHALAAVLEEPLPPKLLDVVRRASVQQSAGPIVSLDAAREVAASRSARRRTARTWTHREWAAIAASLLLGVIVAQLIGRDAPSPLLATDGSDLIARGALDAALSIAASASSSRGIEIGLSYRTRDGDFCRTFHARESALSGIGCRGDGGWIVRTLVREPRSDAGGGDMRMASSALSPVIVAAVEAQIDGEPLTREAESAALRGGGAR